MHGGEELFILFGLGLLAVLLAGFVLGILAFFKVLALGRRVEELRRTLEPAIRAATEQAKAAAQTAQSATTAASAASDVARAAAAQAAHAAQPGPETVVFADESHHVIPLGPGTEAWDLGAIEDKQQESAETIVFPDQRMHVVDEGETAPTAKPTAGVPARAERPEAIVLPPHEQEHAPLVMAQRSRPQPLKEAGPEPIVLPETDEDFRATSLDDEAPPPGGVGAGAGSPPPPPKRMGWEQWIGVRGAAVLGGITLAIAGYLLVQYSIEKGYFTPKARVICAAIGGLLCLFFGSRLRKRDYGVLGNSLSGAGVVLLYASAWASYKLYGFIDFVAAFAAMTTVTAGCAWLANRHASQLVAVLGLTGGFATPLLLSTGQDKPVHLFGYLLLIDLAFLFVAHKRRWPGLGLLALVFTFAMQALWIFARLDAARLLIGLAILGVFALVFAWWSTRPNLANGLRARVAQVGAVLLPFVFALYFAHEADLGRELWPPAALAVVLATAAGWMARAQSAPWLPLGTAAGSVALCLTWAWSHPRELLAAQSFELAGCVLALAIAHHLYVELRDRDGSRQAALGGASAMHIGGLVALAMFAHEADAELWVPLAVGLALALGTQRLYAHGARAAVVLAGGLFAGLVPFLWAQAKPSDPPAGIALLIALALLGLALLAAAQLQPVERRRIAHHAAAVCALFALAALLESDRLGGAPPAAQLGSCLALGGVLLLAATGARASWLFALAAIATLYAQLESDGLLATAWSQRNAGVLGFALASASGALFAVWPFATARSWARSGMVWRIAAFASVPWAWILTSHLDDLRGRSLSWAVPAAFAALHALLAVNAPRLIARAGETSERLAGIARAWHGAAAFLWIAWVPALLADVQPMPAIAAALWGLGLAWLAARLAHRLLPYAAAAATVVATLLVLAELGEGQTSEKWWLSASIAWICFLPAVCALVAARWLRAPENRVAAIACGTCAVLAAFVGLNLEIAHAWAGGANFRFALSGLQPRDLTTSVCWAIYALVLLAIGVRTASSAPRWASLALLLVTLGKVFLGDLGNLTGLYRVGAMLGLALCLILVSLLYQRFVFKKPSATAAA